MIWLLLQCGLCLVPAMACVLRRRIWELHLRGMENIDEHDWNVTAFDAVLQGQKGITVWSDLSNPWLSEYLELALGAEVHLVNIGASRDFQEFRSLAKAQPKGPNT